MATKSILKTVHIKDNNSARKLANALERAKTRTGKELVQTRAFNYVGKEEILKMFKKQ